MRQTRQILMLAAAALALVFGAVACSGTMGSSSSMNTTVSSMTTEVAMPTDDSPGPAFRMVSGKVVKIDPPYYDVEEYTGNRVRLHVGSKTVMINGDKKVGDKIRAEITQGGFANSVQ